MMTLELSTDTVIGIIVAIVSGGFALWARSVSEHNRISELRSSELKRELDELRDSLQDTRENYVTNERFDKFVDTIFKKLDAIIEKLDSKPDKTMCGIIHKLPVE